MTELPTRVLGRRRAGVLLHATSLPDAHHGVLGQPARSFIDWLAAGGFSVWQMLPLGPVGTDRSPYYARSNYALDPGLIDLTSLVAAGLLGHEELTGLSRGEAIAVAGERLVRGGGEQAAAFNAFRGAAISWLPDYAVFVALQAEAGGSPWWDWDPRLRRRDGDALQAARERLAPAIAAIEREQFFVHSQFARLRHYARERGIRLFGDIPIYVAPDSVEVWANPSLFELSDDGRPSAVAGVPPDYFAKDGQRWGNPLYRWSAHERSEFQWWMERLRAQFGLFDLVRIDHFRGLEAYWAVPADASTAAHGEWRPAPGAALLSCARAAFGHLEVVAEDLGIITPAVEQLRDAFGLPGMRVLQFGFDGNPGNVHLPHNWRTGAVAYTGTHDNDTSRGWYEGLDEQTRAHVRAYLGMDGEHDPGRVVGALARTVLASVAELAVIPMQDLLGLGSEARMNTPGTISGNWQWRFEWATVPPQLAAECRRLNELFGRS